MIGNRTLTTHVISSTHLIKEYPESFEEFSGAVNAAAGRLGQVVHHDADSTLLYGLDTTMQTKAGDNGSANLIIFLANGATPVDTADRLEIEGLIDNNPGNRFGFGLLLESAEDGAGTTAWLNAMAARNSQVFVFTGQHDSVEASKIEAAVTAEAEAFLAQASGQTAETPVRPVQQRFGY